MARKSRPRARQPPRVFERSAGAEVDTHLRLAVALTGFWDARGGYFRGSPRADVGTLRDGKPSRVRAEGDAVRRLHGMAQGDFAAAT